MVQRRACHDGLRTAGHVAALNLDEAVGRSSRRFGVYDRSPRNQPTPAWTKPPTGPQPTSATRAGAAGSEARTNGQFAASQRPSGVMLTEQTPRPHAPNICSVSAQPFISSTHLRARSAARRATAAGWLATLREHRDDVPVSSVPPVLAADRLAAMDWGCPLALPVGRILSARTRGPRLTGRTEA